MGFTQQAGDFTALSATGASAESVNCDTAPAVNFLYTISGTGTVKMQQSIDDGDTWTDVASSSSSTDGAVIAVTDPIGNYRPNVTALSSGTITVSWRKSHAGG